MIGPASTAMAHLQHYPLKDLLPKAFRRPNDLASVDELRARGCTALVVACHCCLVRDVRAAFSMLMADFCSSSPPIVTR